MAPQRIVSVFGATGLQGSAVVDALLKDATFTPRAISRDPDSEAARKLAARGVQVVKGDLMDKASLVRALEGSEAVFAVTVPTFASGQDEVSQGKNIVDAAKEVGVKFLLWSSLPSISKASGGKYRNCSHYDDKATVQDYLKSSGLTHASLLLPAFLENYWKHNLLQKTTTGFNIAVPNYPPSSRQAFVWAGRDVPAAALTLFKHYYDPTKGIDGSAYPVVSASMTYVELAARTGEALGVEVTYTKAPLTGLAALDEIFTFLGECDGYYTTPVPNPDLVALGMEFSTVEEFLEAEVRPRFGN
ncbi:hypothetical protein C8R46DRAFT_935531 [Mycena filopes]|nr:hypothetical protein C8R46DRAFT_935531 [Mycena filopes]